MKNGAWMVGTVAVGLMVGIASPAAARRLDTIQKERVREEREQQRAQKAALRDEERERQDAVVERTKREAHRRDLDYDDLDLDTLD